MGKRRSWLAAIKRIFLVNSKEKPANDTREKESKGKKTKGPGQPKYGERKSFKIPLFREPSSIEKILGDAEREHNILFQPPTPPEQLQTPLIVPSQVASTSNLSQVASPTVVSPRAASPRAASPKVASPRAASPRVVSPRSTSQRAASPRAASPRAASPRVASSRATSSRSFNHQKEVIVRPEPSITVQHASATKIQAAFRGYMARRSFRALRGLVRLQGVVRGQNVKRQTMNASKHMHLSVRVQSQIRSWRIQRLEDQARNQAQYKNDKEAESTFGKWSLASEAGNQEYWDDTVHTKEEREVRLQRKAEAAIKRERAMAYAYSHQLSRANPRTAQTSLAEIQSGIFPWWWNWIERRLPLSNPAENQSVKSFRLTPPRRNPELKQSPRIFSSNHKLRTLGSDNFDAATPRSSRSMMVMSSKQGRATPTRTPRASSPSISKYLMPRTSEPVSPFGLPMRDDESLTSCPPFSVPNYMTPTVSARAKARASSNPKERRPGTPSSESSRRLSYPFTRGNGSTFAWNKGIGSSNALNNSHHDRESVGNMSVDSTASSVVGRKPFNRFV